MNRVEAVRAYADKILSALPPEKRQAAVLHTYGIAECCALIALRRGLDAEIAFVSGLLHDLYAYWVGRYLCHAQSGAEMARPFLRDLYLFSEEEQILILSAVYRHANKELVNGPYDEVLKDADTLQPFLSGSAQAASLPSRLAALLAELRIPHVFSLAPPAVPGKSAAFDRSAFAALAEQLAAKPIRGEKDNRDFVEIIRYFPEASAFDELVNAWCAAFVYHCALQSGLHLPLRQPPASYRFACVAAWLQWGRGQRLSP